MLEFRILGPLEVWDGEQTVELSEVAKEDLSTLSMMPEGLLVTLSPAQVRDLIGYLMYPVQVPLPK